MKLFISPGACSLAPHIALRETGADFEAVKVDLAVRKTEAGEDFLTVNPSGKVPALTLDSGETLTENPAILLYIADQNPASGLAPAEGSLDRYRLLSRLSFLGSEFHKAFVPLFAPGTSDEAKAAAAESVKNHLAALDKELAGRDHYAGNAFSVADIYLFVMLGWPAYVGIDMAAYPSLGAYVGKIAQRPAVGAALKAEGLA
ncbi:MULTISPECIES: glutathione transferase GstA [Sphingomonadales]|jgi:glutathione S-transferase|uniref:Glutathione S-transferase n=1 Tax=Sphingobium fuliginis (strain ATCC 27551) TaxID=336203 RepID=A0ABQ1F5H7_SPHSA|nr:MULTISPECIES: glutathione transferase GstA [Sphingomonadaceae]MBF7011819.1 glutathione transferase GstA [Novosphingobium sp. HR1a]RYL96541.1 glutathione transferase GstA [Sphingobium fuliginis]WJM26572.1 glutathione transferase GstA [Novosphingobium resinovorum]GGA00576.1 glutathione S-transferase [Sphingobium fuliginis]